MSIYGTWLSVVDFLGGGAERGTIWKALKLKGVLSELRHDRKNIEMGNKLPMLH